MCLAGSSKAGEIQVTSIKNQTWWQEATGPKSLAMAEEAANMCKDDADLNFVATLPTSYAGTSADYISPMATLTACQLVDLTCTTPASIVGDATEHLYQLNHVYVALPNKEESIKTKDDRLFARMDVWDYTKKIVLAFRSQAMLQLALLGENDTTEYAERLANNELRHPVLASLRVHVKTKPQKQESDASSPGARTPYSPGSLAVCTPEKGRNAEEPDKVFMDAIVVEAAPCTFTEIPNESVKALQGLLARCTQTSERLAAVPLGKLTPSPFHNMLADGKPVHKALTLLHFTQRGNGKQHAHGCRIITERVRDPTAGTVPELTNENSYSTVALCTLEKVLDFTTAKDTTAIAIVSNVVKPSKPQQHAADIYIEAMENVPKDDVPVCIEMMQQLIQISNAQTADTPISTEVAWQQRKCRRLNRYPTV